MKDLTPVIYEDKTNMVVIRQAPNPKMVIVEFDSEMRLFHKKDLEKILKKCLTDY